eukprot:TRINITY_DN5973_c0_g1_i1.p1 TRINITY_DN5973_c0_g1~~TRINITY_DN5973_c0_g1_i1.p1  ORF type:complete len:332 (-),score=55.56 TRINITY_DN5973_c0_g1_i1:46-1041(-)
MEGAVVGLEALGVDLLVEIGVHLELRDIAQMQQLSVAMRKTYGPAHSYFWQLVVQHRLMGESAVDGTSEEDAKQAVEKVLAEAEKSATFVSCGVARWDAATRDGIIDGHVISIPQVTGEPRHQVQATKPLRAGHSYLFEMTFLVSHETDYQERGVGIATPALIQERGYLQSNYGIGLYLTGSLYRMGANNGTNAVIRTGDIMHVFVSLVPGHEHVRFFNKCVEIHVGAGKSVPEWHDRPDLYLSAVMQTNDVLRLRYLGNSLDVDALSKMTPQTTIPAEELARYKQKYGSQEYQDSIKQKQQHQPKQPKQPKKEPGQQKRGLLSRIFAKDK